MSTAKRSHLDIPLFETQRTYEQQLAGLDSIKVTVRAVFGSASLIVSLVGALQLFTTAVAPQWQTTYQIILAAIAVLYALLIIVCVAGMWPVYTNPPLAPDWDTLTTTFKKMNDIEMTRMHLSTVLQAIELNRPIVKRFFRFEVAALIILPIIVILVLVLAWLPRM